MLRLSVLFGVLGLGTLALVGCEDDKDNGAASGASQMGESCERTADCAANMACFDNACRLADSKVTANGKECKAVQCDAAADCCTTTWQRSSLCASYEADCALDPTLYASDCAAAQGPNCVCAPTDYSCTDNLCKRLECTTPADCCAAHWTRSSSCASAEANCLADPVTYASSCTLVASSTCTCSDTVYNYGCSNNICVYSPSCTTDTNCTSMTAPRCSTAGHCVECIDAADCDTGAQCLNNVCVEPQCITDSDCPVFYACQADSTCKRVGCATDRECMTYLDSYLATCNKNASPLPACEESCERDSQCATASNPLRLCSGGRCVDPGCETDEECKIRLDTTTTTTTMGIKYVCRDIAAN